MKHVVDGIMLYCAPVLSKVHAYAIHEVGRVQELFVWQLSNASPLQQHSYVESLWLGWICADLPTAHAL